MWLSKAFLRRLYVAIALLGALALTLSPTIVRGDDTDLVRENTAKPFVFFLTDTSSSMNLGIAGGAPLPLDGDDPGSRIYQVKKVLYEVLRDEIDVNYGFATYNQDDLHIRAKHWLYRPTADIAWQVGSLELTYPAVDDQLVFGKRFLELDPVTSVLVTPVVPITAGSCSGPLALGTDRAKINRYSRLGEPGSESDTEIWLRAGTGGNAKTLQMIFHLGPPVDFDGDGNLDANVVGQPNLSVVLELNEATSCSTLPVPVATQTITLRLVGQFLMHDKPASGGNKAEATAGDWHWTDAFATGVNGTSSPFSGKGIEGNYDSPFNISDPDLSVTSAQQRLDDFCAGTNESGDCVDPRLKFTTTQNLSAPNDRELDRGDLLPWDWNGDNRDDFLRRLDPNHGGGNPPDFGIASYFADHTETLNGNGGRDFDVLPLRYSADPLNPNARIPLTAPPLVAFGASPLARAINDFRCWYNGKDNDQKCRDDSERPWDRGWRFVAADNDALANCRRPFLIVISDGEDTTDANGNTGENPSADVGNLKTKSGEPGVQTWVFNLGSVDNCKGNGELNSIANQGKDDPKVENCITVNSPESLEDQLRKVLGRIIEEARSFASAAVPTVQADEGDKLFLTQFRPARDRSIWRGRILGFLKPVPLTDPPERQPRTDIPCDSTTTSSCFLWDAGMVMLGQVNEASPVGPNANQRRVYYARRVDSAGLAVDSGRWALNREDFDDPLRGTDLTGTTPLSPAVSAQEIDIWRGLGIAFNLFDNDSVLLARQTTRDVITDTYAEKSHVFGTDTTPTAYILGDVFHSNPLVVGSPNNTRFFAQNEIGYREFSRRYQARRSVLMMGSNDGMLHAFDAGVFDPDTNEFTDGTGKEIFAYVPRAVMPAVKSMSNFNSPRLWGVDGTVNAADVFIDPVFSGSPDPDDREWRTVLVGGLRRGGEAYFALDITQPDDLKTAPGGTLVPDNTTEPEIPNCQSPTGNKADNTVETTCHGELGYPAPLWEFDDTVLTAGGVRVRLDEDPAGTPGTGAFDLAQTWSIPNIGRIRVRQVDALGAETEVKKYVAIFGGGLDPSNQLGRGNYLYIVDIETGKAIYKARLEGAAAAEPAAVDTNQDGDLDRIYIGTLAGFLYRVDLLDASGNPPLLASVPVPGVPNQDRIVLNVGDPWVPKKIFDTVEAVTFTDSNGNSQTLQLSRPIYFRPSVIFVAELGEFALAFGTGNRENLWGGSDTTDGRFYIFVDETSSMDPADLPVTQDDLFRIVADDASPDPSDPNDPINNNPQASNPLIVAGTSGVRGWFFVLQPKERVVTNAFALSGITVFSTFIPRVDPAIGEDGGPACALRGISRAFAVFTTNGVGTLFDASDLRVRATTVSSLATEAFIERGETKNPAQDGQATSDALSDNLQRVMDELKSLFPENCKFANYRLDIKTISANTGVVHIAPVPVCIIEKNWREF